MNKEYKQGEQLIVQVPMLGSYTATLTRREAEIAAVVQKETIKELKMNCTPEELAKRFHDHYEAMAGEHNYETRKSSRVDWDDVPENNKSLMIAVCEKILNGE